MDQVNQQISRGEALLILEGDEAIAERHGLKPMDQREDIYAKRRKRVNDIVEHSVQDIRTYSKLTNTLSRLMIKPLTGIPFLLIALYAKSD